jgi:hypothetical protein
MESGAHSLLFMGPNDHAWYTKLVCAYAFFFFFQIPPWCLISWPDLSLIPFLALTWSIWSVYTWNNEVFQGA